MLAKGEITDLLLQVKQGDRHAESRLMAVLYNDLRRIARRLLSRERSDHTLSPTALVNEAYMRLVGQQGWNDRTHFFSVAADIGGLCALAVRGEAGRKFVPGRFAGNGCHRYRPE
jgi:hypothetical protein